MTISISVAPSLTANAVSAIFTSMSACELGKLPDTQAISTPSTSNVCETVLAKQEQLNTLFGYKKSIIYEYVTGKKRVKGAK